MKNYMYEKLKEHIGHDIVCVAYGNIDNPNDICIECEDCNEVLISAETFEEEQEKTPKEKNAIKNLIEAMCNYALEYSWTDTDAIDTLVECGIEEQDFIDCGYAECVEEYFKDDEKDENEEEDKIGRLWDEAWEKEVERRLED